MPLFVVKVYPARDRLRRRFCSTSNFTTGAILRKGPPDFDGDGTVGILDLLTLLANWGPCA